MKNFRYWLVGWPHSEFLRAFLSCRLTVTTVFLLLAFSVSGNDGAVSIGIGGIQLRKENRISMERERLTIGFKKVAVEYEFLNEADKDIITEVAFPIPPYRCDFLENTKDFPDFTVWIEGSPVVYETNLKATLKGKDYSQLLRNLGLDEAAIAIDPRACYSEKNREGINRLPFAEKQKLIDLGLIKQDGTPQWSATKTYHWKATFPTRKIIHVRHEYTAAAGQAQIPSDYFDPVVKYMLGKPARLSKDDPRSMDAVKAIATMLGRACLDPKAIFKMDKTDMVVLDWVDYTLTTANTWKTPVKEFELIVDTRNPWDKSQMLTSFCWDGLVDRLDDNHLVVKKKNFVPRNELAVYFIR